MVCRAKRGLQVRSSNVLRRGAVVAALLAVALASVRGWAAKPGGGGGPPPVGFRYTLIDLGSLGGGWSVANNMNNQGDVVGLSGRADGSSGPFVYFWATDSMHDLNTLIPPGPWILTNAYDINDFGQIVGSGYVEGEAGVFRPGVFLLNPPLPGEELGAIVNLGAPWLDGSNQRATAINNDGDVVGWFSDGTGAFHAFLSTAEDGFVDLGLVNGTNTHAYDISDRSTGGAVTIVGGWNGGTQAWKATCTPGALGSGVALQSLGYLYSDSRTPGRSSAYGVNNLGQIIGTTTTAREDERAARYTNSGGWVSLGTLAPSNAKSWNDSDGQAINDDGYAVGESMVGNVNAVPNIRPFIQHDSFGIRDLASLVDGLASADAGLLGRPAAISSDNLICGPLVTNFFGVETKRAYVLVPYSVNP